MQIHTDFPYPRSTKIFIAVIMGAISIALLSACTQKYGGLKHNNEVTEIFEKNKILEKHRYYYAGFEAVPNAIIAIHNDFQLDSSVWKKISLTPTILNKLVVRMQAAYTPLPRGAWILGPDERRLGIWYSSQQVTAVRLSQETRLRLGPPEPAELRGIP
jgi:hypothetical protein